MNAFVTWLREHYHDLTEPEHAEKASRRERWKRDIWMFGSTIATLWLTFGTVGILATTHLGLLAGTVVTLLAWVYVDYRVGTWGIEYFDITVPWQFRDAEAEERETA